MAPILIILGTLFFTSAVAQQNVSVNTAVHDTSSVLTSPLRKEKVEKLYQLGKVWGFLKYHHPAVANGKYNWDTELIDLMPRYLGTTNKRQASDTLLAFIAGMGDVAVCDSCTDYKKVDIRLHPNMDWINRLGLTKQLAAKLMFIRTNRARGNQHYVRFMSEDDISVAAFDHENSYSTMSYPPVEYRLLALFRYWNIIEYWYPYKYGLGQSWDDVLRTFIPKMVTAANAAEYAAVIQQLIATIRDSHAVVQSKTISNEQGNFVMPCWIKFIEGKLVIISLTNDTLAKRSGLQRGDIIESIDGVPVARMVTEKRPFISASNEASYLNILRYTLVRTQKETSDLSIQRNGQAIRITAYNQVFKSGLKIKPGTFAYERDSSICRINDSIGYVSLGNLQRKDSAFLRQLAGSVSGLIIDNRQYPKGYTAGDIIATSILKEVPPFVRFSSPDPGNPGQFPFSKPTNMGATGTSNPVPQKLVILVNEETQSSTEFQAMMFRMAPGAILMGTATAGADGNVALITLPGNIYTYISGLGVYYPDGKETQRTGLIPDVIVNPTIKGLQENRDELLDKAIDWIKGR